LLALFFSVRENSVFRSKMKVCTKGYSSKGATRFHTVTHIVLCVCVYVCMRKREILPKHLASIYFFAGDTCIYVCDTLQRVLCSQKAAVMCQCH
jgi:hypothetical protein